MKNLELEKVLSFTFQDTVRYSDLDDRTYVVELKTLMSKEQVCKLFNVIREDVDNE